MNLSYEFGMADSGSTPLPIDSLLLGYHEEQQAVFDRQRECQIWYVFTIVFRFAIGVFCERNETTLQATFSLSRPEPPAPVLHENEDAQRRGGRARRRVIEYLNTLSRT